MRSLISGYSTHKRSLKNSIPRERSSGAIFRNWPSYPTRKFMRLGVHQTWPCKRQALNWARIIRRLSRNMHRRVRKPWSAMPTKREKPELGRTWRRTARKNLESANTSKHDCSVPAAFMLAKHAQEKSRGLRLFSSTQALHRHRFLVDEP